MVLERAQTSPRDYSRADDDGNDDNAGINDAQPESEWPALVAPDATANDDVNDDAVESRYMSLEALCARGGPLEEYMRKNNYRELINNTLFCSYGSRFSSASATKVTRDMNLRQVRMLLPRVRQAWFAKG